MTKKFISVFVAVLILVGLVGCAASENTDQSGATQPAQSKLLTEKEAQNIALEHADLTAEQVTLLRTHYDEDDGVPEYEVEFRQGDYEFDYTIHAETGKVLEWDREFDPEKLPTEAATEAPTEPTVEAVATEPPATEAPRKAQPKLSREEARDIALEHAGFNQSQVKALEIEYDFDDGVPEYSVEFYADGWEYDYEIHAETGKILEHHKERD
jgi:uncharacterized membrane protein YkoI